MRYGPINNLPSAPWLVLLLLVTMITSFGTNPIAGAAGDLLGDTDPQALLQQIESYRNQGKLAEAVPLAERYVDITGFAKGELTADFAEALQILAELYAARSRHLEASELYARLIALHENVLGTRNFIVAQNLTELGNANNNLGRVAEAKRAYLRAVTLLEEDFHKKHPVIGVVLNNLGLMYANHGQYREAEAALARVLEITEASYGANDTRVAFSLRSLAMVQSRQGRHEEALLMLHRARQVLDRAESVDHHEVIANLNGIAVVYHRQSRLDEALPMYERALSIAEKRLGAEHPTVASILSNLGSYHRSLGDFDKAERLHQRELAIVEKVAGVDHPSAAAPLFELGALEAARNRYGVAIAYYERALAIIETSLGTHHPGVASILNGLGEARSALGQHVAAESLHIRALAINRETVGEHDSVLLETLMLLGATAFAQEIWADAYERFHKAADGVIARGDNAEDRLGVLQETFGRGVGNINRTMFTSLVRSLARIPAKPLDSRGNRVAESFEAAQWTLLSDAAAALSQMSARFAASDSELSSRVRERQDLVEEWRALHSRLTAVTFKPPDERNHELERKLRKRLAFIDRRISKKLDKIIGQDFPDYATLANPKPLDIAATQSVLRDDEVLLLYLEAPATGDIPGETFVWAVSRSDAEWVRIPTAPKALADKVITLRGGFDVAHARGAMPRAVKADVALDTAHDLYTRLLGPIAELIAGRHLVIVPSGVLTSLPWHLLISRAPDGGRDGDEIYSEAAWLVRDHAITVLPSVASLAALRRDARASAAEKTFIGIGNPLLLGPAGSDHRAESVASCADWQDGVEFADAATPSGITGFFRGNTANISRVRALAPLPETAGELCDVARNLGVPASDVILGAKATETTLKAMTAENRLDDYRVVHFATHGLIAGELDGVAEPALVLTPPAEASKQDDGLLTASEVAGLKLDADWVVLSACNTAAGDGGNAEALSGLARAFFYAGARALLVSHWPVNSQAAVELTTKTFAELNANRDIGRAEALRRAMLALIDSGDPAKAHPAYWAPFVVVGEGASAPAD